MFKSIVVSDFTQVPARFREIYISVLQFLDDFIANLNEVIDFGEFQEVEILGWFVIDAHEAYIEQEFEMFR
ncbi:MAG: hypothetical protein RBG13Loki_2064 [Promethearchaeota archaeon CR_4]|nr:MAG: hypothetical protein RBG13Loki_2064 [Candidatus Lokiarchaeota archaeon CR_4]